MKMISYSHANETYHPKKGLICTLPRLGSEGFGTRKWLIAHLEVGQETGYALGRTAVWDCFFLGGISTSFLRNLETQASPKQAHDAFRHRLDPMSRLTSK